MTSPIQTTGTFLADAFSGALTVNIGSNFAAGNSGILTTSHYSVGDNISTVSIGGSGATKDAALGSGVFNAELWSMLGMAGGTTAVVITPTGGSGHFISGAVDEWAGSLGMTRDAPTFATAVSNTSTAPTITAAAALAQASAISYSCFAPAIQDTNIAALPPSGWTATYTENNNVAHQAGCGAYKEHISISTVTATFAVTESGVGDHWLTIGCYKISLGGILRQMMNYHGG